MFTSMDLLIIAVMALAAAGLLGMALMFLIKNKTAQRVCLYIVAALAVYIGYVGIRINYPGFILQVALAGVLALFAIGAVVLERVKKGEDKVLMFSRIATAAALVIGMANAFMI